MDRKNREIFDAAAALPKRERMKLIRRLLDTLAEPDEFWEEQLASELKRRHLELKAGTAEPIPWCVLRKQL